MTPNDPVMDGSKRAVLPPAYFLMACLVMGGLHAFAPGPHWLTGTLRAIGALPIAAGFALAAAGRWRFTRAGTTIKPFEVSSALVTDGLFRFSRNPMYLGMMFALAGLAVLLGTTTPLVVPPLFAVVITMRFIRREEAMLAERFGDAYREYTARVRRWL